MSEGAREISLADLVAARQVENRVRHRFGRDTGACVAHLEGGPLAGRTVSDDDADELREGRRRIVIEVRSGPLGDAEQRAGRVARRFEGPHRRGIGDRCVLFDHRVDRVGDALDERERRIGADVDEAEIAFFPAQRCPPESERNQTRDRGFRVAQRRRSKQLQQGLGFGRHVERGSWRARTLPRAAGRDAATSLENGAGMAREPVIPQLREREFLSWEATQEQKFELHHGFVMACAGGTLRHDRLAFNLRTALERGYTRPCRTFGSDVKLRVSADTYYYCDAGVVCEDVADENTVVRAPRVVAEVLSASTRAYDLVEKRAAYRGMPALAAYVVVHADMRRIEVDARAQDGTWQTQTYDDDDAFVEGRAMSLASIYAGSSLSEG